MRRIELFESTCEEEWINDELFEMANLSSTSHGIDHVFIWVGQTNKRHGLRVKVSNTRNKFDLKNHFVIQMPSLDYNPKSVAKWIPINKILDWIKLNQEPLNNITNGNIDTVDFLKQISKI